MAQTEQSDDFYVAKGADGALKTFKKKRRKRGPRNSPENQEARRKRHYFDSAVGEAITRVVWLQPRLQPIWDELYFDDLHRYWKTEADLLTKNVIFPAMDKMAENLINIFKFMVDQTTIQDLKADAVHHMYLMMGKWDPYRGTPAFSYFNIVAKNYLIARVKRTKVERAKSSSYEVMFDGGGNPDEGGLGPRYLEVVYRYDTPVSKEHQVDPLSQILKGEKSAEAQAMFERLRNAVCEEYTETYGSVTKLTFMGNDLLDLLSAVEKLYLKQAQPQPYGKVNRVTVAQARHYFDELSPYLRQDISPLRLQQLVLILKKLYSQLDEEV